MKISNDKKYFGVLYAKSDTGFWFCDLITEGFKTEKQIRYYIKDWHENGGCELP